MGTRVYRGEKMINDFHKGGLDAVKWAKSRLEFFEDIVGLEVGVELGGGDAFQGFGEKR